MNIKLFTLLSLMGVGIFLFISCSSSTTITEREVQVPVIIPEVNDTTIYLRDTVFVQDSIWYGEIKDSLNRVIGDLKVYFSKKIAAVNIKSKPDTITVIIPDTSKENLDIQILPAISGVLSWWEKIILYGGIGSILSFLIYMRAKRGKII